MAPLCLKVTKKCVPVPETRIGYVYYQGMATVLCVQLGGHSVPDLVVDLARIQLADLLLLVHQFHSHFVQ